jgi:hypothetical protein
VTARRAAVAAVGTAIARDAQARHRSGELGSAPLAGPVGCEPFPKTLRGAGAEADLAKPAGAYSCLVATARVGDRGVIGYPYRAVVQFDTGRYAFCKEHQVAGERSVPDPRRVVALPAACRVPPAG